MKYLKHMLSYWLIILVGIYALPLAIKNMALAMFVLLIATPIIYFVCSLIYGIKNGFNIIFPVVTAILFIPAIFIFYNDTAWIYVAIYFGLSLVGDLVGMTFFSRKKELKQMNVQDLS